LEIDRTRNRN